MASDNQVALSRMTRGLPGTLSRATRQAVPPFLQKLYEMVSDSATDNLIRWSDNGDSFFVLDHERVAHDVLPRWFKHNNFASFVRQLNMYGFHKIPHLQQGVLKSESETELMNFEHPNFHRGQPDLLCLITRKKQAPERTLDDNQGGERDGSLPYGTTGPGHGSVVDINTIVNGITAIKRHQAAISADLNDLKSSNQHLWQEAIAARERHKKQEDTINRILKFLASVFGNSSSAHKSSPTSASPHVIPRKRQRLMIENGLQQPKLQPLEPLDGEDSPLIASIEPEDIHITPTKPITDSFPFITTQPSPAQSSSAEPIPEKTRTPALATPLQTQSAMSFTSTDPPLSGTFSPSSPFTTQSSQTTPSAKASDFIQPANPLINSSTAGALTSSSPQPSGNQEVLQAILNSPGHLQRLMNLLNMQHSVPAPPYFDLNAPASDSSSAFMEEFKEPSIESQQIQPQPIPIATTLNGFNGLEEPDSQTLSILQSDPSLTFEPLLSNTSQLQKAYRGSTDISAEVDAMQASLDSLIQNLGLDPTEIANMHEGFEHTDVDPVQSYSQSDITSVPTVTEQTIQPPLVPAADPMSSSLNSALPADPSSQMSSVLPDFDFNAFINEYNRQQNADSARSAFSGFSTESREHTTNESTTSPQIGAFVDEVASQSDASSPSMTRTSIDDSLALPNGTNTSSKQNNRETLDKKARKRKSDMEAGTVEQVVAKAQRTR